MLKNNQTPNESSPKLKMYQEGEEYSPFITWIISNGKYIGFYLMALLALIILIYRFNTYSNVEVEANYMTASNAYFNFKTSDDPIKAYQALDELDHIMQTQKGLHAKYDGDIAQILLNRSENPDALKFAEPTLARTAINQLDLQADFSATTLLIVQQRYQEALNMSKKLQKKIFESIHSSSIESTFENHEELFAINLFRIANLAQKLNDKDTELNAWQQWKNCAGLESNGGQQDVKINSQTFHSIIQRLSIKNISLMDYIDMREKSLN